MQSNGKQQRSNRYGRIQEVNLTLWASVKLKETAMLEIIKPNRIHLRPDTRQLIEQVDNAKADLDALRPFDDETEGRIKMAFLPDRVTASLNMEGIVATRRQTLAIMDAMKLSESASKSEQEIFNALRADELVYETASQGRELSEGLIRDINALIEDHVGECPGQYRPRDLQISQANFTPPNFTEVPELIFQLVRMFNQSDETHPVIKAAWLHNRFTYIHPFLDGNGRTARLLQDFSLLIGGLFPTGVPSSMRDNYYDALEAADEGEWDELVSIIAKRQLSVIARATGIANERKERAEWINSLAKRASDRKQGAQHKLYLVWSHRMQEIQSIFEATAVDLSSASEILSVRHENFDVVDFSTWREICERGRSRNSWFFTQNFAVDGEIVYRCVFYFKRHTTFPVDIFPHTDDLVSLFVTGGKPGEEYDFGRFTDGEVRLRELLFRHEELYHYYFLGDHIPGRYSQIERWVPEQELTISEVVQGFYEDIFQRKLGV